MWAVPCCWQDAALHSTQTEGSTILLFLLAFRSAILKQEHRQTSSVHPWDPPHKFATPLSKKGIVKIPHLYDERKQILTMPFHLPTVHLFVLCPCVSLSLSLSLQTYLVFS